ncbi:type VI secretion system amidase effector protein Tae4 [Alkalimarinus coralli]|uniref:type VI secretion system amidase effector protein Tae4 n=1 Tax=Alkalimarinus coralli TaxID=2935863 RepID=UPI00202B6792|nr:type VI secretion system amidase effector protein Tae4 [Alkalimarinus coralli]
MSVSFGFLWANHPANNGFDEPCATNGVGNFENQCAIRMGVALSASGVSLSSFRSAKCWHGHKNHVLRAQELADWLAFGGGSFGRPAIHKSAKASSFINSGIVFFKNFWGRGNQGDHIDLWDGQRMTKGDASYFGYAEEVWFWRI